MMTWGIAIADGGAGRESLFSMGAGARGLAMGRAFVALPGDASSLFSNPAASSWVDRIEFTAFHTSLFAGTNYDCIGLSYPIEDQGVMSLSAGLIGTGDILGRDDNNIIGNTFSSNESQIAISYARKIRYGISSGISLKTVSVEVGGFSGYGFGADLGFQYSPGFADGLILGLAINDLLRPSVKLQNTSDKFQSIYRFGASYGRVFSRNFCPRIAFEYESLSGKDPRLGIGAELALYDRYYGRFGLYKDSPTVGIGVIYSFVKLDYALENVKNLGASHRVSFGLYFGKSVAKSRQERRDRIVEEERRQWEQNLTQERRQELKASLEKADSLKAANNFLEAWNNYRRALMLDSTSQKARVMSDSMLSAIIAGAVASSQDEKRAALIISRIQAGMEAFKKGDYDEAIAQYGIILELDPANQTVSDLLESARAAIGREIDGHRTRARSLQSAGNYSDAIIEWNGILKYVPDDTEALAGIDASKNYLRADSYLADALTLMRRGNYQDALRNLEQAQRIKPNDSTISSLLSEARAKSAPLTSIDDIKSSSQHWPIYLRGLESYQKSEYSEALKQWESLQEFYPNNPDLEHNISQAKDKLQATGKPR